MLELLSVRPIVTTRYMRWTRSSDRGTIALTAPTAYIQNEENEMKIVTIARAHTGGGLARLWRVAGGRASYTMYSVAGRIVAALAAA